MQSVPSCVRFFADASWRALHVATAVVALAACEQQSQPTQELNADDRNALQEQAFEKATGMSCARPGPLDSQVRNCLAA